MPPTAMTRRKKRVISILYEIQRGNKLQGFRTRCKGQTKPTNKAKSGRDQFHPKVPQTLPPMHYQGSSVAGDNRELLKMVPLRC